MIRSLLFVVVFLVAMPSVVSAQGFTVQSKFSWLTQLMPSTAPREDNPRGEHLEELMYFVVECAEAYVWQPENPTTTWWDFADTQPAVASTSGQLTVIAPAAEMENFLPGVGFYVFVRIEPSLVYEWEGVDTQTVSGWEITYHNPGQSQKTTTLTLDFED